MTAYGSPGRWAVTGHDVDHSVGDSGLTSEQKVDGPKSIWEEDRFNEPFKKTNKEEPAWIDSHRKEPKAGSARRV